MQQCATTTCVTGSRAGYDELQNKLPYPVKRPAFVHHTKGYPAAHTTSSVNASLGQQFLFHLYFTLDSGVVLVEM